MKSFRMTALLSTLMLPMSAYAHPGHGEFLADLVHVFAGLNPLSTIAAVVLIVSLVAWRMRQSHP